MSSGAILPPIAPAPDTAERSAGKNPTNSTTANKKSVELCIDTSTTNCTLVDTRQQDCVSNQSNSDSGLGYTNSISSDNSVALSSVTKNYESKSNKTTKVALHDRGSSSSDGKLTNRINNGPGITNRTSESDATTKDRLTSGNHVASSGLNSTNKFTNHNRSESSNASNDEAVSLTPCSKVTALANKQPLLKLDGDDRAASAGQADIAGAENWTKPVRDNDVIVSVDVAHCSVPAVAGNECDDASMKLSHSQDPCNEYVDDDTVQRKSLASEVVTSSGLVASPTPIMKSILRKATNKTGAAPKQKRSVSFNQTVIVFCEEIDVPSINDHGQSDPDGEQTIDTFKPPEGFCDHKVELTTKQQAGKEGESTNPATVCEESLCKALSDDGTSRLTDDQLIGLLENESLLETFRLNCEDFSVQEDLGGDEDADVDDEGDNDIEDFHLDHIESGHRYFRNGVVPDYDTDPDSESSMPNECNDEHGIHKRQSQPMKTHKHELDARNSDGTVQAVRKNSNSRMQTHAPSDPVAHELPEKDPSRKSMPARLRVSTVDSNLSKNRQTGCKVHSSQALLIQDAKKQLSNSRIDEQKDIPKNSKIMTKSGQAASVHAQHASILRANDFTNREQALSNQRDIDSLQINPSNVKFLPNNEAQDVNSRPTKTSLYTNPSQTRSADFQNLSNNQPPVRAQQPSCHLCRLQNISNLEKSTLSLINNSNIKADVIPMPRSNSQVFSQRQPTMLAPKQLAIFNSSCVSCHEAMEQNMIQKDSKQSPNLVSIDSIRPMTYQVVYLVDQNGNRVRALSLVRPQGQVAPNAPGSMAARRVLLAPNDIRFQDPSLTRDQISKNQPSRPYLFQYVPGISANNQIHQSRIVGSASQASLNSVQPMHELKRSDCQSSIPASSSHSMQRVVVDNSAPKQHTIYYVRQPLGTQNIRQFLDGRVSNTKSFPEPHEVRRLDGLRCPATPTDMANRLETEHGSQDFQSERGAGRLPRKITDMSQDDFDDPSFGFSKRPSVKVVASNSITSGSLSFNQRNSESVTHLNLNRQHQTSLAASTQTQENCPRPISMVVMRSQTLDRRVDQHSHHDVY